MHLSLDADPLNVYFMEQLRRAYQQLVISGGRALSDALRLGQANYLRIQVLFID